MSGRSRRAGRSRGEPLLALVFVLGGWLSMRLLLWQSPFALPGLAPVVSQEPETTFIAAPIGPLRHAITGGLRFTGPVRRIPASAEPPGGALPALAADAAVAPIAPPLPPRPPVARPPENGHLLVRAAFSDTKLPPEKTARSAGGFARAVAPAVAGDRPLLGAGIAPSVDAARWSGDAWILQRDGSGGPAGPSYGRSQAGAVLRYRLAPASGHRPFAYARVTRTLAGPRETEVAAGFAARPLASVPVSVAAELRATDVAGWRELRPAAFAVTELPPARLPLGLRAEAYAQAGYVGGRFATAFVDGQARLDSQVARVGGEAELRVGAGLWGGAEKGAARLDVGPSAVAAFRLGDTQARIAADYRWRVAGNARPKSGPAVTFSAGF